jgi:hypothetical protein
MSDIHHRLTMNASREQVFAAVTDAIATRARGVGALVRTLVFDRGARAVWRCDDGPPGWTGTEIVIELTGEGDETVLRFTHGNWKGATDVLASWATRWASLLLGLQSFVQIPEPDDTRV